jgi:hypothetical protein
MKKNCLLLSAASLILVISTVFCLRVMQYYSLCPVQSPSKLFLRYNNRGEIKGWIPVDDLPVSPDRNGVNGEVPFYVIKDGATDCSIVSVLMLLMKRDSLYIRRLVRNCTKSKYDVRFPGSDKTMTITDKELKSFQTRWDKTRPWYNRIINGNLPKALMLLRCAYYRLQAEKGIRCCRKSVHGGGFPYIDLILFSGVSSCYSMLAAGENNESFYGSSTIIKETFQNKEGEFETTVKSRPAILGDPLQTLGTIEDYLVILSSVRKVPRLFEFWKPCIIPNHTYYLLGITEEGKYVLGNSYNTLKPIILNKKCLTGYFKQIDFISLTAGIR